MQSLTCDSKKQDSLQIISSPHYIAKQSIVDMDSFTVKWFETD